MPNEEIYEGVETTEVETTEGDTVEVEVEENEAPEVAAAKPAPKISRPKDATKPTGQVWAICDKHWGSEEFAKLVREEAKEAGINPATCSTQMSRYKKFMEQEADSAE